LPGGFPAFGKCPLRSGCGAMGFETRYP